MLVVSRIANCSSFIIGNALGFVAKQSFCVNSLEPVRLELEKTISRIASTTLGNFVGNLVGKQLSYLTAIPMTVFLGNLIWSFIAETTQTAVSLVESAFSTTVKLIKPPFWLYGAVRIASFAVGYLANTFFCFNAMPIVKSVSEHIIRELLPFSIGPLVSVAATCVTPTITFALGDLVGMVAKQITVFTGDTILDMFATEELKP